MANIDLRPKEKLLVEYLLQGLSLTQSVKKAGFGGYLQRHPQEVWNKSAVQKEFRNILIERGITNRKLVDVLLEGLQATKPVVIQNTIHDYPDYNVRNKYFNDACRLLGLNPDEESTVNVNTYEERLLRFSKG